MPEYNEIMEQHQKKGSRNLQVIVQDEMSKMDETFDKITSVNPVMKALHRYMEAQGLALLMQGGKINPDQLAARLGFTADQVKEAMAVYSQHLKQVFANAERRFSGRVPWKKYEQLGGS